MNTAERAQATGGGSAAAIHALVRRMLRDRHPGGGTLVDVGCGSGTLWRVLSDRFDRYVGVDLIRYDGFPAEGRFHEADLDRLVEPPVAGADVVAAVETIEHLENPRAFLRLLTAMARPGGWMVVTTPNQHSALSKTSFLLRGEHAHFHGAAYPAHITALLEGDLRRMAAECGWTEVVVEFSGRGRIPGTGRHWPAWFGRHVPRLCSDNLLVAGRRG